MVQHLRALKFRNRALQVAFFAKLQSSPYVILPGFKSRLVQSDLVVDVPWIGLGGFEVIVHRRVVVLQIHRMAGRFVVLIALRAPGREHADAEQNHELTPTPHELSGTSTGGNPCLSLLMESSIGLISPASRQLPAVAWLIPSHVPVPQPFPTRLAGSWQGVRRARQLFRTSVLDVSSGKMKDCDQADQERRETEKQTGQGAP